MTAYFKCAVRSSSHGQSVVGDGIGVTVVAGDSMICDECLFCLVYFLCLLCSSASSSVCERCRLSSFYPIDVTWPRYSEHPCHLSAVDGNALVGSTRVRGPASGACASERMP